MNECRLCGDESVGRFQLSRGCVVYPDDREQMLCLHHAVRSTPLGTIDLIEDFTLRSEFSKWWNKGMRPSLTLE